MIIPKVLVLLLTLNVAHAQFMNADWYDRRILFVNQTNDVVVGIYGSNVDRDNWENNIFPEGKYLLPGYEIRIDFDDRSGYCMFDILVVYVSGDTAENRNVNVCEIGTINLKE